MANLGNFNAHDVEPTISFQPLPAGRYLAAITASEIKPTRKGDGKYLQLEFTVVDGQLRGRKVWDRLCINHPNEMTQKIARGNLSAICRAVGVMQPRDSVELHNLPLWISVKCKRRDDASGGGEITNEIKGYEAKGAGGSVSGGGGGSASGGSVSGGGGGSASGGGAVRQDPVDEMTPPWKR